MSAFACDKNGDIIGFNPNLNKSMNFITYLQNKKSYILAIVLAFYSALKIFGVINTTADQDVAIYGLLGALFGISLKAGINRELGKMKNYR